MDIYIFRRRFPPPSAGALKSGAEPWRKRGDEVSSFEKKVEGRAYVVKAEGPGPRGGLLGNGRGGGRKA